MKVNLFFTNGVMTTLCASLLCEALFFDEKEFKNIICLEQFDEHDEFYNIVINEIISISGIWENKYSVQSNYHNFSRKNLIHSMQLTGYYKFIAAALKKKLNKDKYDHFENIIFSSTARLWPYFRTSSNKKILIEHGSGEYIYVKNRYRKKSSYLKLWLTKIWNMIFQYECLSNYSNLDTIYLCSELVKFNEELSLVCHVDTQKAFCKLADNFWENYKKKFPDEYSELNVIREELGKNKDNFYYLVSNEVDPMKYPDFIQYQKEKAALPEKGYYIIKSHPSNDENSYNEIYSCLGTSVTVKQIINKYIPAEFLIYFFDKVTVIGSNSSTLLYVKTWMPHIPVIRTKIPDKIMISKGFENLQDQIDIIFDGINFIEI
ncbi:MAG: hypothetical protein PHW04_02880 [Candidatus Wallbacteria bacterium]|nr:hypothetical protein [Candidatus Wallbacteria bacterium]